MALVTDLNAKILNKFTRSHTSKDNGECKQVFKVSNILNATIINPAPQP